MLTRTLWLVALIFSGQVLGDIGLPVPFSDVVDESTNVYVAKIIGSISVASCPETEAYEYELEISESIKGSSMKSPWRVISTFRLKTGAEYMFFVDSRRDDDCFRPRMVLESMHHRGPREEHETKEWLAFTPTFDTQPPTMTLGLEVLRFYEVLQDDPEHYRSYLVLIDKVDLIRYIESRSESDL